MEIVAARANSFNLMCRLCLSTDDYLISVFDKNYTFLPQRIAACVSVEVHVDDNFPSIICKPCFTKVDEWFNFKKCCDDSQAKLRQWSSINNIICSKAITVPVKDDFLEDSDDIQIIENEISIIKEELIEDDYLPSDTEETQIDPFALQPCDPQNSSAFELTDSLLVPTYECPATVHGMNAPPITADNRGTQHTISSLTKKCRICEKEFSNAQNRIRHERTVHNINSVNSFVETSLDSPSFFDTEITNIQSLNSEDSNSNNADESSDVTLEELAADLPTEQSFPVINSIPKSERHFIAYNKILSEMISKLRCYFCGISYAKSDSMLSHLSKMMAIEKFTCFSCCIAFPNRSQYMKHVSKKFCKQRARLIRDTNCSFKAYQHYKCTICEEIYVHKKHVASHLLSSHLQPNFPPSCDRCAKPFENLNEYKEHLQDSCFYQIYCSICKISCSPEEFIEHCKIHEDNNEDFNFDDYINKKNDCRNRLPKPMNENYTRSNKYSCSRCGAQFSTLDMWCEHQKIHSGNDVFRCTDCNRVFVTEHELEDHKSTHANNNIKLKLYRCSNTNNYTAVSEFSSTSDSPQLEQNIHDECEPQEEEEKKFICGTCKRCYNTAKKLQSHKRVHRGDTHYKTNKWKKRKFVCPKCKRGYGSPATLGAHKKLCFSKNENPTTVVNIKKEYSEVKGAEGHVCQVCNKSFPTERGLVVHSKIHTSRENESGTMQCQVCNGKFVNIEALLDHLKSHSTKSLNTILHMDKQDEKSVCQICNKICLTRAGLSSHIKSHNPNLATPQMKIKTEPASDTTFKCNFCGMEFESRAALNPHIKIHLNGANIAYNCTFCPKVCQNSYQLANHVRFRHSTESTSVKIKQELPNYSCHICKKNCPSNAVLQRHLKTHAKASVNKKFKCNSCLKILPSAVALQRHLKGNCLHCSKCNKKFATMQAHTAHKNWHLRQKGNSLFNCKQCQAEFDVHKDYVKHLKSHKKTFKCKLCPKAFHYMKSLLTHTTYAHGSDSLTPKASVKNPGSFKSSIKIKREVKTEVKQVPPPMYRCTECNTTFVNSKRLRIHVLSAHMAGDM